MKNKFKTFIIGLFITISTLGVGFNAFAYSGLLDEYSATDVSIAGIPSIDSWYTYGHAYVQHWNDTDGSLDIVLQRHDSIGWVGISTQRVSSDYSELTFTLPTQATYRLYFKSASSYYEMNFNGNVWDYQ